MCSMYVCVCVCMGFMALITAMVLCARFQDSLLSVSVRRVHAVFSTAAFKGREKVCSKTLVVRYSVSFQWFHLLVRRLVVFAEPP